MNRAVLRLAWLSLWNRRGSAALTVFTIAIAVLLLLAVDKVRSQARESFASTVSGVDLIVGARTGPIQLLLYSVFRIGDATNNISWQSYREIAAHPSVAWAVPIALGDSHRGYRVVATTTEYFERLRYGAGRELRFASGRPFEALFEAVIGAEVARALRYELGEQIIIAHGASRVTLQKHDDLPFRVVGILERTGTPVDHSVHVSLASYEAIHVGWQHGIRLPGATPSAEELATRDLTPASVTAVFLGLNSRVATFSVQRQINNYRAEPLLAILPGVTLQQLWSLLGVAENALLLIAACVVVAGLLGMLSAILTTLNERRREMAILRSVGARPLHVFGLLLFESGLLALLGASLGLLLSLALFALGGGWVEARFGLPLAATWPTALQWQLLGLVVAAGLLVGLLPAWMAFRRSLADGMTIRS